MVQPQVAGLPPMIPPPSLSDLPQMPPRPQDMSVQGLDSALAQMSGPKEVPTIDALEDMTVTLPAGWFGPRGELVTTAVVRELTGYDEERLAKIDMFKNVAQFTTALLEMGVEHLGQEQPSKEILKGLLVGDRDALMLGIRRATYGNEVKLTLTCSKCNEDSEVTIEIDKDVEIKSMEDQLKREFDVKLKHGAAKVSLVTGFTQEAVGAANNKTPAELNTLILADCVVEINGHAVLRETEPIRRLSASDRATIIDFIIEQQPGPKLGGIEVPCAVCGQEYPISLGLGNLFRL